MISEKAKRENKTGTNHGLVGRHQTVPSHRVSSNRISKLTAEVLFAALGRETGATRNSNPHLISPNPHCPSQSSTTIPKPDHSFQTPIIISKLRLFLTNKHSSQTSIFSFQTSNVLHQTNCPLQTQLFFSNSNYLSQPSTMLPHLQPCFPNSDYFSQIQLILPNSTILPKLEFFSSNSMFLPIL